MRKIDDVPFKYREVDPYETVPTVPQIAAGICPG